MQQNINKNKRVIHKTVEWCLFTCLDLEKQTKIIK